MSAIDIRAERSDPNNVRRLRDLRSQRVGDGAVTVKDIWSEGGAKSELLWMLRLIEFRGAAAKLYSPPGTSQLIVGLSGPQVRIGSRGGVPLRRERSLTEATEVIELHRPAATGSHHIGVSLLVSLSFTRDVIQPAFRFDRVSGTTWLDPEIRAVIVLEGELEHAGRGIGAHTAILLRETEPRVFSSSDARVLLLRLES